jgi:hypothetical protein
MRDRQLRHQQNTVRNGASSGALAPIARGPLLAIAGVAMLALALTSGRYGYHRDELYFIAAGAHPAFGYPDQPLLAPLLARAMDLLAPDSLLVLRAPAILACGLTIVTTGLLARELGGDRRAQALAGTCWAAGAVCLVTGHFLTTTTYDVCATAVVSLLIARVLRTGDDRWHRGTRRSYRARLRTGSAASRAMWPSAGLSTLGVHPDVFHWINVLGTRSPFGDLVFGVRLPRCLIHRLVLGSTHQLASSVGSLEEEALNPDVDQQCLDVRLRRSMRPDIGQSLGLGLALRSRGW